MHPCIGAGVGRGYGFIFTLLDGNRRDDDAPVEVLITKAATLYGRGFSGTRRVGEGILIELKPEERQTFGRIILVTNLDVARNGVLLIVECDVDFIIGPVLPIMRPWFTAAGPHIVARLHVEQGMKQRQRIELSGCITARIGGCRC